MGFQTIGKTRDSFEGTVCALEDKRRPYPLIITRINRGGSLSWYRGSRNWDHHVGFWSGNFPSKSACDEAHQTGHNHTRTV
jgi:hypothetical protein